MKIGIIYSDYYREISDRLLCDMDSIARNSGLELSFHCVFGAFDIPAKLSIIHRNSPSDGYVVCGCILRGETMNNEIIASAVANAVSVFSVDHCVPVGFGILTVDNIDQAYTRSQGNNNYGTQALNAVIKSLS